MSSFKTCPTAVPGVTRMEFDYYHQGTNEEFEEYYNFVRQVALEDFELCEKAQANLERGVYGEGILNPNKEKWVVLRTVSAYTLLTENQRGVFIPTACPRTRLCPACN